MLVAFLVQMLNTFIFMQYKFRFAQYTKVMGPDYAFNKVVVAIYVINVSYMYYLMR